MAAVNVKIAVGKASYQISCEEGEEETIKMLAQKLNKRINDLSLSVGRIDDKVLLLMAGLMMESEIDDIKKAAAETQQPTISKAEIYDETSKSLESVIKYVEELANKIKDNYN